ncbi:hypothetical protein L7F22_033979 [Adiantum nelumboides]|nr:hypothetical protein [Adiantum nelumboides]
MDIGKAAVVFFSSQYEEDIQSWVLQGENLMYMLGIVDDKAMATFMYQGLCKDARQFYIGLPTYVQRSWSMMKHALLTYFVCSKPLARGPVYFCGTANECIRSWIAQVEREMVHLGVKDDTAKAVYASQGLSHNAFVFLHMLPEIWRYSWLSLKFSLLIHYQRWPVSQSSEEAQLIIVFESLQVEPFEAIDVKLADIKELEAVEPLDEQVLDDELEEDDPLTWQVIDLKVCKAVKDVSNVFKGFVCLFAGIYVMRYVLEHQVASTYANDVEGSLEVLECGLASVGILACSYAHDYVEGIAINVIHVFDMVYEKSFDVKKMPSVLSRRGSSAADAPDVDTPLDTLEARPSTSLADETLEPTSAFTRDVGFKDSQDDKLNAAKDTVSTGLLGSERRADDDSTSMFTTTPGHNDNETPLATVVGSESKNRRDNDNLEKNDNIIGLAIGTTSSLGVDEGKSLHTNEGIEPRSNAEAPFHNAQENVKEDEEYYVQTTRIMVSSKKDLLVELGKLKRRF